MIAQMNRRYAIVLSALLINAACFAWGAEGHKIVGAIAAANLTPETAKAIRALLGDQTVADACCWADEIKSNKKYDWIKPLHYINVPMDATSIDMNRDSRKGVQIVSAIMKYKGILNDTSQSKEDRLQALRLLLHMVGDVHQPFHVSYEKDLGGNKLTVQAFGKKSNMHQVWDSVLIQHRLNEAKGGKGDWVVMSADLRKAITAEQQKKWLQTNDPLAWANESFTVTRELYKAQPTEAGVDEAYYKRWMPTCSERLQMAGVRLGALLNECFASAPATSKSKP